jgi:hypothetical protein
MKEIEKMQAGLEYCYDDEDISMMKLHAIENANVLNSLAEDDLDKQHEVLSEILGSVGEKVWIAKRFCFDNGKNIFIGNTRELKSHGIRPLRLFKDYDYGIWIHKGNIYLAGADRHRFNKRQIAPNHNGYIIGSMRAAVDFMERFMDVRFLYPGIVGTDFVKKEKLTFPGKYKFNGTTTLNTIALMKGAHILRVHDVREAVEAVKIVEKLNGIN